MHWLHAQGPSSNGEGVERQAPEDFLVLVVPAQAAQQRQQSRNRCAVGLRAIAVAAARQRFKACKPLAVAATAGAELALSCSSVPCRTLKPARVRGSCYRCQLPSSIAVASASLAGARGWDQPASTQVSGSTAGSCSRLRRGSRKNVAAEAPDSRCPQRCRVLPGLALLQLLVGRHQVWYVADGGLCQVCKLLQQGAAPQRQPAALGGNRQH